MTISILLLANEGLKYVGALGGLAYIVNLISLFANRIRLKVRDVQDSSVNEVLAIRFEVENFGRAPTSIQSLVTFTGFLPRPRKGRGIMLKKYEFELKIENSDRSLPPYSPKTFQASRTIRDRELLTRAGFTFFRTYTFCFTRGRTRRVRIRSASGVRISYPRYLIERWLFRPFGGRLTPIDDRSKEVTEALSN